ncbi:hypothetical protein T09_8687 [Trichinella sp. T9]|nr:hypothetical protein T09_8687 [Trichinella sp. T9]
MSLKLKIILLKVPICITIGWLFNSVHATVKSILKNDTEDIKGKLGIRQNREPVYDVEKNGFFEKRLEMEMKCRLLRSYSKDQFSRTQQLCQYPLAVVLFLSSGWNHMVIQHSGKKIKKISKNVKPRATPGAMPQGIKNLHIPPGYAPGILLHNICPQGCPRRSPGLCPRA